MAKMNKDYKKRWVAALRSDKYNQGMGNLCYKGTGVEGGKEHCCLGVLFNVVTGKNDYKNSYLSARFLSKVGFDDEVQKKLANLNDSQVYSFENIAKWIVKNL